MPDYILHFPEETFIEDKDDFLLAEPNQTLNEGEENLTDDEWLIRKSLLLIKGMVMKGRRLRAEESLEKPVEPEITLTRK